jgi:hypothetical protein
MTSCLVIWPNRPLSETSFLSFGNPVGIIDASQVRPICTTCRKANTEMKGTSAKAHGMMADISPLAYELLSGRQAFISKPQNDSGIHTVDWLIDLNWCRSKRYKTW